MLFPKQPLAGLSAHLQAFMASFGTLLPAPRTLLRAPGALGLSVAPRSPPTNPAEPNHSVSGNFGAGGHPKIN